MFGGFVIVLQWYVTFTHLFTTRFGPIWPSTCTLLTYLLTYIGGTVSTRGVSELAICSILESLLLYIHYLCSD
jgi:hypothetical protein